MTWTRHQQIALAVVPKCSAFMSFFGSCWIVSEVLFDEQKKVGKIANVYSRLLLGMSFFEALESIWNFQSTWPIPVGTDGVYGAIGNTQYCVAQGFFLQLGLAVPMYNASLSIYYLLVIKYNLSDSQLQRRVEPYMHATAISIPFSTAMACVALNLFNNANLWCWIAPYPLDCADTARFGTDGNCIRGDNAWIYRWSFYFAPLWSCIITAIVTMMVVYKTVRFTDVRSLKYRKPQVTFGASTTIQQQNPPPPELPSSTTRRESNLFVEPVQEEEFPQVYIEMDAPLEGGSQVRDSVMDAEEPEDDEDCSKSVDDRTFKFRSASFSLGRSSHLSIDSPTPSENNGTRASSRTAGCSSKSSLSIQSLSSRVKHWNKVRAQDMQDHHRSHDVFVQALWYTAAFLVTHLFSTVNRSLQLSIGHTFFPLLVMHSFFDPFQGTFRTLSHAVVSSRLLLLLAVLDQKNRSNTSTPHTRTCVKDFSIF